jgi:hypothetical protein
MTMFGADQPRAAAAATARRLRNSVDSDPIRCLQRLQRRRTGMAHCGTQQTPGLSHARNGVVRGS